MERCMLTPHWRVAHRCGSKRCWRFFLSISEAVDILKEMKEKDVPMNDTHMTTLFHALNAVAAGGDIPSIRRLQDTVFTLGLVKPTANLCSPVVTAYLVR